MRGLLLAAVLTFAAGCSEEKKSAEKGGESKPAEPKPADPKPVDSSPPKKDRQKKSEQPGDDGKKNEQKPNYNVSTAGEIDMTQPADMWGLPDQNRAVLKDKFFGKRWNIKPSGNISVEPDHITAQTHPHTQWLTVTVKFRDPKDLLTFDRYKSKINGYCVDAFTFVDCVYVK